MYENFCIFIAQIYRTYLLCANFYILMNFNMILRMVSDVRNQDAINTFRCAI